MCTRNKQQGLSLIELVAFIAVVSIAAAGVMLVMSVTASHSADPLLQKQALAVAEALLEEVELAPFATIDSYHGANLQGGVPATWLRVVAPPGYDASVEVEPDGALGPSGSQIPSADARRIKVRVIYSGGEVVVEGYRTKYTSPTLL